jgi:hypothetical protein
VAIASGLKATIKNWVFQWDLTAFFHVDKNQP